MIESVFVYKPSVSSLTVTESRVSQRANYINMVSCDVFRFSWFGGEAHYWGRSDFDECLWILNWAEKREASLSEL